jgi:hypothetical protein
MGTIDIASIVALLGAMSLSVERVVEIVKSMVPFLAQAQQDAGKERWRRISLYLLSTIVGTLIAFIAQEQIQPLLATMFKTPGVIGLPSCFILGLLSSGGSGFWNQSLSIVEEIRKAKKLEVKKLQTS